MTIGLGFDLVVAAAKLGATWAWSALYGQIAGPVMGYFRVRGVADPQSAAGDVFFELSRDLETFDGDEEAFMTLVFAAAYRRLMVEGRHPRRNARSALADRVLDQLQSEIEVVIDDTEGRVPDGIREAFEKLHPEQRDVLSLRIVAGLDVEQTARVIGSDVEAVKSAQRDGLTRIRAGLGPAVATA